MVQSHVINFVYDVEQFIHEHYTIGELVSYFGGLGSSANALLASLSIFFTISYLWTAANLIKTRYQYEIDAEDTKFCRDRMKKFERRVEFKQQIKNILMKNLTDLNYEEMAQTKLEHQALLNQILEIEFPNDEIAKGGFLAADYLESSGKVDFASPGVLNA